MRLHLIGVVIGLAFGFLIAALVSVLIWAGLVLLADGQDPFGAIALGTLVGAFGAGLLAGHFSLAKVFNGGVAGALFTGSITILSVLDGSPAPTSTIALYVIAGLLLGLLGGWTAERRAQRGRIHSA